YVKSGKLKGLAVTTSRRLDDFPDIPTMIEAGLPGYDVTTWYGFVARAGTPSAVLDEINAAFNMAIQDPAVRESMRALGIGLVGGTRAEFAERIRTETDKWGGVLRKAGMAAGVRQ